MGVSMLFQVRSHVLFVTSRCSRNDAQRRVVEGSPRHGKHPVREAKMTETLGFGLKLKLPCN